MSQIVFCIPLYKSYSNNASARLSKEYYFLHIFSPELNIKNGFNNLWTHFDANVYFT